MKNKLDSKKILCIVAIIVVLISLILFFSLKSSKSTKKNDSKKENYSVYFDSFSNGEKIGSLEVVFKNNKVNDVIVIYDFDSNAIAKEVAAAYKDGKEFKNIQTDGTKLVMHYNDEEINKLVSLDKADIISRFEGQGYKSRKNK